MNSTQETGFRNIEAARNQIFAAVLTKMRQRLLFVLLALLARSAIAAKATVDPLEAVIAAIQKKDVKKVQEAVLSGGVSVNTYSEKGACRLPMSCKLGLYLLQQKASASVGVARLALAMTLAVGMHGNQCSIHMYV